MLQICRVSPNFLKIKTFIYSCNTKKVVNVFPLTDNDVLRETFYIDLGTMLILNLNFLKKKKTDSRPKLLMIGDPSHNTYRFVGKYLLHVSKVSVSVTVVSVHHIRLFNSDSLEFFSPNPALKCINALTH